MPERRVSIERGVTVLGFALLLPMAGLYLVSGLVVPLPWLAGVWALGVALVVAAVMARRRPWVVLATPFVGVFLWFVIVSLGGAFLDWTA